MKFVAYTIVAIMTAVSLQAASKEIIRGEGAQKLYYDLIEMQVKNPNEVTSYVNGYFGDSQRPELGKLWVTTIYPTATKDTFCYEYDFRDSSVKEYLCELYVSLR